MPVSPIPHQQVSPFDRTRCLQLPNDELSEHIVSFAIQFAVLGYVDAAMRLISLLNQHDKFHRCQISTQNLWILWKLLGRWPEGEEEQVHEKIENERKRKAREREGGDGERNAKQAKETLAKIYDQANDGSYFPDVGSALVSALDLSLMLQEKGEEQENGGSPEEILKEISERIEERKQVDTLTESKRAWSMLKEGALAKLIGDVIADRVRNGKQEEEEDNLSISEILAIMDDNIRTNLESHIMFEELGNPIPDTLLHPPAPTSIIEEAEKRLNIKLPSDYKEFLSITNGLERPFGGVILEPPLHTVDNICWFSDNEDYFYDLPLYLPSEEIYFDLNYDFSEPWPSVGKAIKIGSWDIFYIWLLPPANVAEMQAKLTELLEDDELGEDKKEKIRNSMTEFAGSMEAFEKLEWCCVRWAAGSGASMTVYPSFRAYLGELAEEGGKGAKDLIVGSRFIGLDLRAESAREDEEDEGDRKQDEL
ncbi:hypothetical protein P154DRAFT_485155 [Amniculicola lignicola CBS 123094]|uniref:Knr4/Smi1-like domain-containing protein n=1 Tax=Amniculicola lignicola CBS 123094 TaxID=1392246 RepID=A0A6A5WZJ3_9PLEO|nr:hypothetical protein P154DRAFT_485155 [Amniculicola lignicola CBS 123094]